TRQQMIITSLEALSNMQHEQRSFVPQIVEGRTVNAVGRPYVCVCVIMYVYVYVCVCVTDWHCMPWGSRHKWEVCVCVCVCVCTAVVLGVCVHVCVSLCVVHDLLH